MGMVRECPGHRADFEREVERWYGGDRLRRIAAALDGFHHGLPDGSLSQNLAIYSNEIAKAADDMATLKAVVEAAAVLDPSDDLAAAKLSSMAAAALSRQAT